MGSTTPCPNHFAHSFSREALDLHELTCPTVTHALVPQLYEALDPEFLTRRVRRKAFDFSLFEMLGEAMKVHCAPIRDGLVDDMVRTAIGSKGIKGSVAMGLRKCFDCVEIMKLVSYRTRSSEALADLYRILPIIKYMLFDLTFGLVPLNMSYRPFMLI